MTYYSCLVCRGLSEEGSLLCDPCGKSYSKTGPTMYDAIKWAADRAVRIRGKWKDKVRK